MMDPDGTPYGTVEIRRVQHGAQVRYRAIWRGDVLGWSTSLRLACERVHAAYVRTHGPQGGPVARWEGPGVR